MVDEYFERIKAGYLQGDARVLFKIILAVAEDIGRDQALALLERCVTEKRLSWAEHNLEDFKRTDDPVFDGYRLFYETYWKVSVPEDGEIVARTAYKLVIRWWNPCPTLDACQRRGLNTREICHKVYCRPVQELIQKLDPRLKFTRNYAAIRPYAPYCEEIIYLEA
jgi:hypothetical protein